MAAFIASCVESLPGIDQTQSEAPGTGDVGSLYGDEPGTWVPVGTFEGFGNTETGEFEVWMVDPATARLNEHVAGLGQLDTGIPGTWCEGVVATDGNLSTNPAETFQLVSDQPGDGISLTAPIDCRSEAPPNEESGNVGAQDIWTTTTGIFCPSVTLTSFHASQVGGGVAAELTLFEGDMAAHAPMTDAQGGSARSSLDFGTNRPSLSIGTILYPPLTAYGQSAYEVTRQWHFMNLNAGSFTFRGRLMRLEREICGNGISDDCDNLPDEGCFTFPDGAQCASDADCISGRCGDSNTCAATCSANSYGSSCLPCPTFDSQACGGPDRGTCFDRSAGDGTCNCWAGLHGSSCQFSCADGQQNGNETSIDNGGDCAQFVTDRPRRCNGIDHNGNGLVDEAFACEPENVQYGGHSYFALSAKTWSAAAAACQAESNYHLMKVNDAAEWSNVSSALSIGASNAWIGLNDIAAAGSYLWQPYNAAPSYSNWPGSPPDAQNCVYANGASGLWYADSCTSWHIAICESFEPTFGLSVGEDADLDGIHNNIDTCPNDPANDFDGDNVCGDIDNCRDMYNPRQLDTDGDSAGDSCDYEPRLDDHQCDTVSNGECPAGCDAISDPDCTNICGNSIVESNVANVADTGATQSENCDGAIPEGNPGSCSRGGPSDCDDANSCTVDYTVDLAASKFVSGKQVAVLV